MVSLLTLSAIIQRPLAKTSGLLCHQLYSEADLIVQRLKAAAADRWPAVDRRFPAVRAERVSVGHQ